MTPSRKVLSRGVTSLRGILVNFCSQKESQLKYFVISRVLSINKNMTSRDQRRIVGPEKTVPFNIYQEQKKENFLTEQGCRLDGRTPEEIRPICKSIYFFLIPLEFID